MAFLFEQQPKESNKAFAAFTLYLGMGAERSIPAVAGKLSKSVGLVQRWSSKFDWPARVQAHSEHLAVTEREATEVIARSKGVEWAKRQQEQREEEWRVRCEVLEMAREAIARWKANDKRCGSLEGIARLLELASKLGRLASGMATDKTEVTGEVDVTVNLEFEAALKKVYGPVVDVEAVPGPQVQPVREFVDADDHPDVGVPAGLLVIGSTVIGVREVTK